MANRKVKFDFNPLKGVKIKPGRTRAVRKEIKDFVREKTIEIAQRGVSPVSGHGKYKRLTKQYAVAKKGGNRLANLTLEFKMLNSAKVTDRPGGKMRLTVPQKEQKKADGHCNFTGKSSLPKRTFVPDEKKGETFKREIWSGIKKIVRDNEV